MRPEFDFDPLGWSGVDANGVGKRFYGQRSRLELFVLDGKRFDRRFDGGAAIDARLVRVTAEKFMSDLASAEVSSTTAVGIGTDVRISGASLTGAALVVDDRAVHATAFSIRESEHREGAPGNKKGSSVLTTTKTMASSSSRR